MTSNDFDRSLWHDRTCTWQEATGEVDTTWLDLTRRRRVRARPDVAGL